jgi:hypothetical protein
MALGKLAKIARGTARVAQSARKNLKEKPTQTTGEMSAAERAIERELATDKVAKGSRAENITVGSKSEVGGVVAESTSKAGRKAGQRKAELQRKVDDGKATKAEKAELKQLRLKDQLDLSRAQQSAGQTRKSTTKAERTDYIDPETGEIFGKPTKNQLEAAARNARARGMTAREREYKAFLEKEYGVKFYAGGIADSRYVNLVTTVDRRKKK